MSAGWDCVPLRELCDFHNGLWTGKKGPFETANVVRNTNFTADGRIDLSDIAVLQVEARQFTKRRLQKGDIIIEKSGGGPKQPVGRVVLFELDAENYSFSNFTSAIRVKHPKTLDSTYLHRVLYWWYVSGLTEPLQRRSTGIRNLDFDAYKNLEVPVPLLDEQKRIVAMLDAAFAALDRARFNAEANLGDVRELETTLMVGLLSGLDAEMHSLGDVCEIYQPRTISTKEMTPDGQYVVFGANGKIGRYNEYNHADSEVLVTCRGATCGQVNVSEPFSWVTGNAMVVRPKTTALRKDFLEELLRSSIDWSEVITGAAQPQITRSSLSPVEVSIPDVRVQEEVVGKMKTLRLHLSKLREASQAKLADIAALRQSLLQAAFSGQLT